MSLLSKEEISNLDTDLLSHYGIPGQKKGIRRWQYEDGRFNEEGKVRYFGTKNPPENKFNKKEKEAIKLIQDLTYINKKVKEAKKLLDTSDKIIEEIKNYKWLKKQISKITKEQINKKLKNSNDLELKNKFKNYNILKNYKNFKSSTSKTNKEENNE